MGNVFNDTKVADDTHVSFGDLDNFKLEYSSANTRLELKNSSDTVRMFWKDEAQSGTSTPTGTNVANIASVGTQSAQYARIGDTVQMSGRCTVTPTAGSTFSQVRLTLPIASNLGGAAECAGSGSFVISSVVYTATVNGDATNDELLLSFVSNGTGAHTLYYSCLYQVN